MNYDVRAYTPGELSSEALEACVSLIKRGCAVTPGSAEKRLPLARMVVIVHAGQEIAGVGAIKQQRPDYALDIATKSGCHFDPKALELGYVVVEESHRHQGLSGRIVAKLLSNFHSLPLFAASSNQWMKNTLRKVGFARQRGEWTGNKGDKLSLWIKKAEST